MATEEPTEQTAIDVESEETARLLEHVDENAEDLADLLEILTVVQGLSRDLAPELREAVDENRDDLRELRVALEREETIVLLTELGHRSETLLELREALEVAEAVLEDLTPEIRRATRENRDALRRLRTAVENEELLVLVERLGENAGDLAELLELVGVTRGLVEDLVPEVRAATGEHRSSIRELRLLVSGMADAYEENGPPDSYELGRSLGNMTCFADRLGDPRLLYTVDAGMSAFTDDSPPEDVSLRGLVGRLRDGDVRRGLATLLEALARMGRAQSKPRRRR